MKTRSKLMAALAMLLVSTIMMTTASFAWFTISTAPEISNIDASATANGNLEIALYSADGPGDSALGDSGSNTKWGNLVDLSTEIAALTDTKLKPVQLSGTTVYTPRFGADGRLLEDLVEATATGDGGVVTYQDGDNTIWAIGVKFYLRSNVAGDVTLTTTALDRGAEEAGLGTFLTTENNFVKVAFVVDDAVVATLTNSETPSTAIVTLEENVAQLVTAIIYLDGENMTNAGFANEEQTVDLNIQFTHETTLVPMAVTGNGNGRVDATP